TSPPALPCQFRGEAWERSRPLDAHSAGAPIMASRLADHERIKPGRLQGFERKCEHVAPVNGPGEPPMFASFTKLLKNEDGATAIEYGLIAALIAVAA